MKSWNKNKTIISILLFLILLFSIILYVDLKKIKEIGDRKIIGIIRYKQKIIQRKFDGDVVWQKIERDTYITNRDTVRTTSDSILEIELNDKTEIKMDENSMIVLDFSNEKTDIDFAYGSLSAKTDNKNSQNSKLNVKSGDKTIELGNSNASLTKTNDKNINLQIDKGSAVIKTKDGEQNIQKNESANLAANKIEVQKKSILLNEPLNQSILITNSNSYLTNFSWETEKQTDYVLEISENQEFTKKIKTINVTNLKTYSQKLSPSKYFWRILNLKEKNISSVYKFTILKQDNLEFSIPEKNAAYKYSNSNPIVFFGWNKIENCKSYKLEISKDSEFKNIIYDKDIISNRVGIDSLLEGKYFSRLTSKPSSSNIQPQVSSPISFSIIKTSILDSLELTSKRGATASQNAVDSESFVINWKSNPEFEKYEIEISEEESFKNKKEYKTKLNYFSPSNLKKGKYFYRVRGITKENKSSEFTVSDFSIKDSTQFEILNPKNNSEFLITENDSIDFNWTKSDLLASYNLEISKDENFSNILKKVNLSSNKISIKDFNAGNYFTRVRLISTEEKKSELMKSNIINFRVLKLTSNIKQKYPIHSEIVDLSIEKNLILKWEPVNDAKIYIIEIFEKTNNGDKLILSDKTNDNIYKLKDIKILDEGKFKWSVQAIIQNNSKEFKTKNYESFFEISLSSNTKEKPLILSPNKQHVEFVK